ILFGLPGIAGSYTGALVSNYISATIQLLLFAGVMLLGALMMFKNAKLQNNHSPNKRFAWWLIALEGLTIGVIAGLVGVGGGFLIVTGLVLVGGMSMQVG